MTRTLRAFAAARYGPAARGRNGHSPEILDLACGAARGGPLAEQTADKLTGVRRVRRSEAVPAFDTKEPNGR